MFKYILTISLMLFIGHTSASAEERFIEVEDFSKVSASDAVRVIIRQGSSHSVSVDTSDDEFENVFVKSDNGTLYLGRQDVADSSHVSITKGSESSGTIIKVERNGEPNVTVERSSYGTSGIAINGQSLSYIISQKDAESSNISVGRRRGKTYIEINNKPRSEVIIRVTVTSVESLSAQYGASIVADDLNIGSLMLDTDYSGEIELAGSCNNLSINTNHSARVDAQHLDCHSATIEARNGARVQARATQSVTAGARYNARIRIFGRPETLQKREEHGGTVKKSWFW